MVSYNPVCYYDNLILGTGDFIIVTGWSLPTIVEEKMKQSGIVNYAAIGSLYSNDVGVNAILHNLIANPQINLAIGIAATSFDHSNKGIEVLNAFFDSGFKITNKNNLQIRIICYQDLEIIIDNNIPTDFLKLLRKNVKFVKFQEVAHAVSFLLEIDDHRALFPSPKPWHSKKNLSFVGCLDSDKDKIVTQNNFDDLKTFNNFMPLVVRDNHLTRAWLKILHKILRSGWVRKSRHGENIKELLNVSTIIYLEDIISLIELQPINNFEYTDYPFSKNNYFAYINSFRDNQKDLVRENQDSGLISYSYPNRIYSWFGYDQLTKAIESLQRDLTSNPYISLWDVRQDSYSSQPPCLCSIAFRVCQGKLNVISTFRSHDIYNAWLMNTAAIAVLTQKLFKDLICVHPQIKLGTLTITSQSAHFYQHSFLKVQQLIDKYYLSFMRSQFDSLENQEVFIIEVDKERGVLCKKIFQGKVIWLKYAKKSEAIEKAIVIEFPDLTNSHFIYLGRELAKAEIAYKNNLYYSQDRMLILN